MDRVYQPEVIRIADEILESLIESKFFEEHEITDLRFAKTHLCEKLTEKYIENGLDAENGIFTEEEFNDLLKTIITGSILYRLKDMGYIESYDDDDTEEMFFLNEKGKKLLDELRKESGENS